MQIRLIALPVLIASILAGFGYCGIRISALKVEVANRDVKITQLESDIKSCTEANDSNMTVIGNLRNDKVVSEKLIDELQKKKVADKKLSDQQLAKIRASSDNTPASPILIETIDYIIKGRL